MGYGINISEFIGKTFVSVEMGETGGNESIIFTEDNGNVYKMFHSQDCCEHVYLEDMEGEFDYLINTPILYAEESTNSDNGEEPKSGYSDESYTWTYYKLATIKGNVDLRWYGSSNGYYGESVDIYKD